MPLGDAPLRSRQQISRGLLRPCSLACACSQPPGHVPRPPPSSRTRFEALRRDFGVPAADGGDAACRRGKRALTVAASASALRTSSHVPNAIFLAATTARSGSAADLSGIESAKVTASAAEQSCHVARARASGSAARPCRRVLRWLALTDVPCAAAAASPARARGGPRVLSCRRTPRGEIYPRGGCLTRGIRACTQV